MSFARMSVTFEDMCLAVIPVGVLDILVMNSGNASDQVVSDLKL